MQEIVPSRMDQTCRKNSDLLVEPVPSKIEYLKLDWAEEAVALESAS
jgi:hypothetical protein